MVATKKAAERVEKNIGGVGDGCAVGVRGVGMSLVGSTIACDIMYMMRSNLSDIVVCVTQHMTSPCARACLKLLLG
jgi:hypothetical protein